MFEGPLLRGHRPHALEFSFQVAAGGLSEWGPRPAGLGNATGSAAAGQEVAGSVHPAGNRVVGVQLWVTRKGRAFPGDQPYQRALPQKAPHCSTLRECLFKIRLPLTVVTHFCRKSRAPCFSAHQVQTLSAAISLGVQPFPFYHLSLTPLLRPSHQLPSVLSQTCFLLPAATASSSHLTWTLLRSCSG